MIISFTCQCGSERLIHVQPELLGPDAEVVAFVADAETVCTKCDRTLRALPELDES